MKEIEKYIGYYLLVYLVVLAFCGFFQYMYECQGQSLSCAFSKDGFNTIITTTAYVLTPIIAIIGFQSWKNQFNSQQISHLAQQCLNALNKNFETYSSLPHFLDKYKNDFEPIPTLTELQIRTSILEKDTLATHMLINRLYVMTKDYLLRDNNSSWFEECNRFTISIAIEKSQEDLNRILIELNKTDHHSFKEIEIFHSLNRLLISYEKLEKHLSQYILIK